MNELNFKLPIKFTKDYTIIDSDGTVLCPCIIYRSDSYHLAKQKFIGEYIVSLVNNPNGYFLDENNEWKKLGEIAKSSVPAIEKEEQFEKKVPNPWGRSGRPK